MWQPGCSCYCKKERRIGFVATLGGQQMAGYVTLGAIKAGQARRAWPEKCEFALRTRICLWPMHFCIAVTCLNVREFRTLKVYCQMINARGMTRQPQARIQARHESLNDRRALGSHFFPRKSSHAPGGSIAHGESLPSRQRWPRRLHPDVWDDRLKASCELQHPFLSGLLERAKTRCMSRFPFWPSNAAQPSDP